MDLTGFKCTKYENVSGNCAYLFAEKSLHPLFYSVLSSATISALCWCVGSHSKIVVTTITYYVSRFCGLGCYYSAHSPPGVSYASLFSRELGWGWDIRGGCASSGPALHSFSSLSNLSPSCFHGSRSTSITRDKPQCVSICVMFANVLWPQLIL